MRRISPHLAAAVAALVSGPGIVDALPPPRREPPAPKPLTQADLDRIEAARLKRERRAAKRKGGAR